MKKFSFFVLMFIIFCSGASVLCCNSISCKTVSAELSQIENSIDGIYSSIYNEYTDFASDYTGSSLPSVYCMRDDYILYTENQSVHGLCWAFSSSLCLSTTLMKATNEFYDFSEGYVVLAFNHLSNSTELKNEIGYSEFYNVGAGGNFIYFDLLSKMMGVVLEQDFNYEQYFNICNESAPDYYEFFSKYADKNILENVEAGTFNGYTGVKGSKTLNAVKSHIVNHGSVYASLDWDNTASKTVNGKTIYYKVPNESASSGHAVSLIGWDDNIKIGTTTGAWIMLNSWGDDSGDQGIYYIAYDDTDFNSLWGYRYSADTTDIYFNNKITSSNATFNTSLKGAYYNTFAATTSATQQKNIFKNSSVNLTYTYNISNGASISDVQIYRYQKNVTSLFSITKQNTSKTVNFSGSALSTGAYKIITTFTDGTTTENHTNMFYVMDGTELNYAEYNSTKGYMASNAIKNNGTNQIFDDHNIDDKNLVLASSNSYDAFMLKFYAATYSDIISITPLHSDVSTRNDMTDTSIGKFGFQINFEGTTTEYPFNITTASGTVRQIKVIIFKATSTSKMANVLYDLGGGLNNINNPKRVLVSSSASAGIYAPTKDGYDFAGWYRDADCTMPLSKSGERYLLSSSYITTYSSPTLDSGVQSYFDTYYAVSQYVFLYAKWKETAPRVTVTFIYNNGEGSGTTEVAIGQIVEEPDIAYYGYTLIGWYTDPNFTNKWNFNTVVTADIKLYAKWSRNEYTVKFYYDNTWIEVSVKHGDKLNEPTGISHVGSTLKGWYLSMALTAQKWDFDTPVTSNMDLWAKWQKNVYTITFVFNNGDSNGQATAEHGGTIAEPTDIIKTGHTLEGWYVDSNFSQKWDFNNAVTGNMTLYAKWNLNEYTVTFVYNNGTSNTQTTVNYGNVVNEPTNLFKEGYNFGGWYSNSSLTKVWDFSTPITANTILYAKWTVKQYSVTVVYNNGAPNGQFTINHGNLLSEINIENEGHTFAGWYADSNFNTPWSFSTPITQNQTIYAKWNVNVLTVTVNYDNGTPNSSFDINYGEKIEKMSDPAKEGFTFKGWYTDKEKSILWDFDTPVKSNITLYAKWGAIEYTITFVYDNGAENGTQSVEHNGKVIPPVGIEKEGHALIGWFIDEERTTPYDFEGNVTGPITLYAKWSPITYYVELIYNFNGIEGSVGVEYGQKITFIPEENNEGYTLEGWYVDEELTIKWNFDDPVTGELKLYANWIINKYTVTLVYNNGLPDGIQSVEHGETLADFENPEKDGYTFAGWYTDEELTNLWDINNAIVSDIKLYAYWSVNTYIVKIVYNNGLPDELLEITYGEKITEITNISKQGYSFGGWYVDEEYQNAWDFDSAVESSMTLYAKWQLKAIQNLQIYSNNSSYEALTSFTINIAFTHELENDYTIKVQWFRNGALITTTNTKSITQNISIAGVYSYSVIIMLTHQEATVSCESDTDSSLKIEILNIAIKISDIEYLGFGRFTWKDEDSDSNYIISLCKNTANKEIWKSEKQNEQAIDVWQQINADGLYYILIEKFLSDTSVGQIQSELFAVVKVEFETFSTDINEQLETIYVDEGIVFDQSFEVAREGYIFDGWFTDIEFQTPCIFPLTITQNLCLYANWKLTPLQIDNIEDITTTYDKDSIIEIIPNANHSVIGTYSYVWICTNDNQEQEVVATQKLTRKNVRESGTYFCRITLVDADGFSTVGTTNVINIQINKAETEINVVNVKRAYTYNGEEQVIESGATLTRDDEVVPLIYSENKFTDVPEDGVLMLQITAPATENYEAKTVSVEITVNKAQSSIEVKELVQEFIYRGVGIIPKYSLSTNQVVDLVCDKELINVGNYEVYLVAQEDNNYLSSTSETFTVKILKATIEIHVKNLTSFWLFPQKELTYEIEGEYYGQHISVELECDIDVNKPGKYDITAKLNDPNANFDVKIFHGTYTVTLVPYIALGILLLMLTAIFIMVKKSKKFYIEFEENGGNIISPIEGKHRAHINIPEPTRNGFDFVGWYYNSQLTREYDGKVKKGKPITLYAKWEKKSQPVLTREESINQILKDLNIVQEKPQEKKVERPKEPKIAVVEPLKKTKTREEILRDLIVKAQGENKSTCSSEEINNLIDNVLKRDD